MGVCVIVTDGVLDAVFVPVSVGVWEGVPVVVGVWVFVPDAVLEAVFVPVSVAV